MTAYLRTELHCHTSYSEDSLLTPEKLVRACRGKGIQRLVITDHNTIKGAVQAKELDPEMVVIGEEIKTSQGELLAAYLHEEIPPGLSPLETIALLREQEAFIYVAHPFDFARSGHWPLAGLLEITPYIDAIEIFNARNMWPLANLRAQNFARQQGVLGTVGSDAHTAFELGMATMLLPPFEDGAGLKLSLRKSFTPRLSLSGPWVHLASRYAVWKKKRGR
jgi:predicted metal-dependent phosphoesterase TrpH